MKDEKPGLQEYLFCGIPAGIYNVIVFHPVDRALHLSIKHHRPYFVNINFTHPYHGLNQTWLQRVITGGAYFVAQSMLNKHLYPVMRDSLGELASKSMIGVLSGSVYAVISNTFSAIKCHTWNSTDRNFIQSIKMMRADARHKSVNPFLNGLTATLGRDVISGCSYELIRHLLAQQLEQNGNQKNNRSVTFACNLLAASVATVFCTPLNYVRNMQQAKSEPDQVPPTIRKCLSDVWKEASTEKSGLCGRVGFFMQVRCKVGVAVVRTSFQIAGGQFLFDETKKRLRLK